MLKNSSLPSRCSGTSRQAKFKKGFSLGEVIIAAFVLTVGIVSALGLLASSISNSAQSRNQIIATNLAQEGTEIIRNIRDNNVIKGKDYNNWLTDQSTCADYLTTTDADTNPNFNCPSGYKLYYNSDPNVLKYSHNSSYDATPFSRVISISNPAAGEIDVTSTVWWSGSLTVPSPCNAATKCVSASDVLTEHP